MEKQHRVLDENIGFFTEGALHIRSSGILVVAAIWALALGLKYADRIREAQARGAFTDMNTHENKSRFRCLAVFTLIGLLGMILSITILAVQLRGKLANLYGITVAVALIFGAIASVAGFLMRREINRRL